MPVQFPVHGTALVRRNGDADRCDACGGFETSRGMAPVGFLVVQAMASSRQAAFVAVASVAEILEPATAAAPEIPVDVHVMLSAGSGRPVLSLVVLAWFFCCSSARGGRCRHRRLRLRPAFGH